MQKTQRKTIAFPNAIISGIEIIARGYDMDFSDYMRFLATKKVEENEKTDGKVYYMSNATGKAVVEGEKEYDRGETKGFTDIDKLMEHLTPGEK